MLEYALALGRRKRLLGKSRQQICIWVCLLGQSGPQAVIHDFGYFSHVSLSHFRQSSLLSIGAPVTRVLCGDLSPRERFPPGILRQTGAQIQL